MGNVNVTNFNRRSYIEVSVNNPYNDLSDENLMELYIDDDFKAFEILYSRYKGKIYGYLYKRAKSESHASDIFQNVMMKFHKSRFNYNSKYSLSKWIFIVARSELIDFYRRNKIDYVELKEEVEEPNLENHQKDDKLNLDIVQGLTSNEKSALEMRYFKDNEFSEISRALNITESNARKIISRSIKKIKKFFQERGRE